MDKDNAKLTLLTNRLNTIYQTEFKTRFDKCHRVYKQNAIRYYGCQH